nr:hypothetical protein [Tanacetum cinerariifolium]
MASIVFGKGTRLERAATARKDPNVDNKRDEAIAYNTPVMSESRIYIPWKFRMASGVRFCMSKTQVRRVARWRMSHIVSRPKTMQVSAAV